MHFSNLHNDQDTKLSHPYLKLFISSDFVDHDFFLKMLFLRFYTILLVSKETLYARSQYPS